MRSVMLELLLSNGSTWESTWYPGEASGEARTGGQTGILSLSFLSLVDALFLLCPWFFP